MWVPPLVRVDVVDEREDVLGVARVIAHREGDRHVCVLVLDRNRVFENRLARLVEVGHELAESAVEVVLLAAERLVLLALVLDRDCETAVEVGQLAHPVRERLEAVLAREEDAGVGPEVDMRAGLLVRLHRAELLQLGDGRALLVGLLPDVSFAADRDGEPARECIHAAHADAVEPARHLVGVLVELAAGVEDGHHDLDGRAVLFLVEPDRDPAPVVPDGDRVVLVDLHLDAVAVAGERLVDRVVDDLVDEVVEAAHADVADVHRGALADGFEALEDLDVVGLVLARRLNGDADGFVAAVDVEGLVCHAPRSG